MVEEKKKSNNVLLIVVAFVLLVFTVLIGAMFIKLNIKYNEELKQNVEAQENLTRLQEVADSYQSRLEGIKDKDDLLKRDIFVYIDTKYIEIPKSVALDISENVVKLSKKYNISPELIVGIIQVESSFNPMAVSPKKARGLMQVMPEWVKKIDGVNKITDLHDIDTNINTGIQVLLIHIEEAGGSLSKGLYYYVGKSDSYVEKVYRAIGQFVAFRSTIDDRKLDNQNVSEDEKGDDLESEQGTTDSG